MKKVSDSQAEKDREVARIKLTKPERCLICGGYCKIGEAMHLLPKSTFPEWYTLPENIDRAHHECHKLYDDKKAFRSTLKSIIKRVQEYDEKGAYRYFNL